MKKKKNINKKETDNRKNIEINTLLKKVEVGVNKDNIFVFTSPLTVTEFAKKINKSASEIIRYFLLKGQIITINTLLSEDQIAELCVNFNLDFDKQDEITEENILNNIKLDDKNLILESRPPVVTVMGHVDHGKTSLLDTIRNSHVRVKEAGGITQHIGAYQIKHKDRHITFIDTPGHEAFSEMRARGAEITDIIILVVAADDGVMPQTIEAIDHAKASNAKLIVFVNKMDKPTANVEKILAQLSDNGVVGEEWGGETVIIKGSALTNQGINELLDAIFLITDLQDYKAAINSLPIGTVLESRLDKGSGPLASILVQKGVLKKGDYLVVGATFGRVRTLKDENNHEVDEARPSKPVVVSGLNNLAEAGDKFIALRDEKLAKSIANKIAQKQIRQDRLFQMQQNNQTTKDTKVTNVILRADVNGSIEAIKNLFEKINIDGTTLKIIRSAIGAISESDVKLAKASNALIIGFNVRPVKSVRDLANNIGIKIIFQNVIYALKDQMEKILIGTLDPVYEEEIIGEAKVQAIFKASSIGTIAGCVVTSGKIVRNSNVRVIRDGIVVYTSTISSLKHLKDDVKEIKEGKECGLTITGFNDIKENDILECFIDKKVDLLAKMSNNNEKK
ncbi:MAG: translation initiation factor IF-2 [Mycoplasmataceae bacterium]|nr:translation initiation factor IF-2 [Mycoplasmataceae bacterium]